MEKMDGMQKNKRVKRKCKNARKYAGRCSAYRDFFFFFSLLFANSSTAPPRELLLGVIGDQVAVANNTLLDELVRNDFALHVLKELDLFTDEVPHAAGVEGTVGALLVTHVPVDVAATLLEHFEAVLGKLMVQLVEVRNGTDGGEDGVVLDGGRARAERSHHTDTLGGSQGTESLVLDVTTLEDDGGSLKRFVSLRDDNLDAYMNLPSGVRGPWQLHHHPFSKQFRHQPFQCSPKAWSRKQTGSCQCASRQ